MHLGFIIGLLALNLIVLLHELGHYIFARLSGIGVEVFSVGIGKPIVSYTDSRGTKWQIAMIPVGGYAAMKNTDDPSSVRERNFREAGLIRGVLIAVAGPLFNFLTAFFCFFAVCLHIGKPVFSSQVLEIKPDTPAALAQIQPGDKVLLINGKQLKNQFDILDTKNPELTIQRGDEIKVIKIEKKLSQPYGIVFNTEFEKISPIHAIGFAFGTVCERIWVTLSRTFDAVFSGNIIGPLGIMKNAASAQKSGLISFILFIASLSIGIGAFNLLPIPALDGGRALMFVISAIIRRPVSTLTETILNYISVISIAFLFLLGFFTDIKGLFK